MNKKGVSMVMTVVLLIMFISVGVGIIWGVTSGVLQGGTKNLDSETDSLILKRSGSQTPDRIYDVEEAALDNAVESGQIKPSFPEGYDPSAPVEQAPPGELNCGSGEFCVRMTSIKEGDTFGSGTNIPLEFETNLNLDEIAQAWFIIDLPNGNRIELKDLDGGDEWSSALEDVKDGEYEISLRVTPTEEASEQEPWLSSASTFKEGPIKFAVGNLPPIISITSPSEGQTFTFGNTVLLAVDAQDPDGGVVRVNYFDSDASNSFVQVNTAPFSFEWNSASVGTHIIKAQVHDNEGAIVDSESISFIVEEAPEVEEEVVVVSETCIDSDGGDNPETSGNVQYQGRTNTDLCQNNFYLQVHTEYYCDSDGIVQSKGRICDACQTITGVGGYCPAGFY